MEANHDPPTDPAADFPARGGDDDGAAAAGSDDAAPRARGPGEAEGPDTDGGSLRPERDAHARLDSRHRWARIREPKHHGAARDRPPIAAGDLGSGAGQGAPERLRAGRSCPLGLRLADGLPAPQDGGGGYQGGDLRGPARGTAAG